MVTPDDAYRSLMAVETLAGLAPEEALKHIGALIDVCLDLGKTEGLERAIQLSEGLGSANLSRAQLALLHYFQANAWAGLRSLRRKERDQIWEWEQNEIEQEIIQLRMASRERGFGELPDVRRCQILTNLGNLLDHVGRFVEALEYWERALERLPRFGMALGNRGRGRIAYARVLYDEGQARLFLKQAYPDLTKALSGPLEGKAGEAFAKDRAWIESVISSKDLNEQTDIDTFPLGNTENETQYRRWCLNKRLFLNPLNDLGPYPIAARDILTTPSIVVPISEGPYYPGLFNQLKQEFVSARYVYYEAIHAGGPHFSDREVFLFNTLDYPVYSLASEKAKMAFRVTYSLFDKIAYFLNHYLKLSIPERNVTFRTFWYESRNRKVSLRPEFRRCPNWPLRGLFWLSKDLHEEKPGFREAIEPDAQELAEIRNHLEHKYLKLHDELWAGPPRATDRTALALADTLAFSRNRRDFERKALKLLKMVRAALIYLSLAIHAEERRRKEESGSERIALPMYLDVWEDRWKM